MKTKNMLWAALSMTAALVMTACTNDDNTVETPAAPQAEVKTIPYSVTVSGGDAATTRATVDEDMRTLRFAAGDKLYVFDGSSVVKGVLTLKSGDEGKSSGATFEGSLSYTGDEPAADHELNAVLVGSKSKLSTITDGGLSAGPYPTTSYCDDVATAVEEWSWLAGTGTYGEKSFTLSQSTTFLNFEITFEDGTKSGTTLTAVVKQNSTTTFCTADVTTKTEDGKVVAKFVLPLDDGYKLDGATVKMGDKEAISFGGDNQKLLGKVYNVKRTYAAPTLAQTMTTAGMTVKVKYNYDNDENYCLFSSNGNGTYTFQSGYGNAGGDEDCAKALVVEGDKLVFKQNFYDAIDNEWDDYGFSATFDTSNNTYSNWVGQFAQQFHNPSFISVEVNSVPIALTQIITVADLVKTDGQGWFAIIDGNSDKIKEEGGYVVRISDDAKLQCSMWGGGWQYVNTYDYYQSMYTYKFEGD